MTHTHIHVELQSTLHTHTYTYTSYSNNVCTVVHTCTYYSYSNNICTQTYICSYRNNICTHSTEIIYVCMCDLVSLYCSESLAPFKDTADERMSRRTGTSRANLKINYIHIYTHGVLLYLYLPTTKYWNTSAMRLGNCISKTKIYIFLK